MFYFLKMCWRFEWITNRLNSWCKTMIFQWKTKMWKTPIEEKNKKKWKTFLLHFNEFRIILSKKCPNSVSTNGSSRHETHQLKIILSSNFIRSTRQSIVQQSLKKRFSFLYFICSTSLTKFLTESIEFDFVSHWSPSTLAFVLEVKPRSCNIDTLNSNRLHFDPFVNDKYKQSLGNLQEHWDKKKTLFEREKKTISSYLIVTAPLLK